MRSTERPREIRASRKTEGEARSSPFSYDRFEDARSMLARARKRSPPRDRRCNIILDASSCRIKILEIKYARCGHYKYKSTIPSIRLLKIIEDWMSNVKFNTMTNWPYMYIVYILALGYHIPIFENSRGSSYFLLSRSRYREREIDWSSGILKRIARVRINVSSSCDRTGNT